MLFILVCYTNSDPKVIGKRYLKFLFDTRKLPYQLRIDRGTETGKMSTIQVFMADRLNLFEDPIRSVIHGPSTSNKIERWWRDLHERLEKYFKTQLTTLLTRQEYDPHNAEHRQLLAYVYIPILQRECDIFVCQWNAHRIRSQDLELPTGIPDHMFEFPEKYGGNCEGTLIPENLLDDVARVSGVLSADINNADFLEERLKERCQRVLPNPANIDSKDAIEAYRHLKNELA